MTMEHSKVANDLENCIDYRPEGGPKLSLLWSKEQLIGQTLYLGGEVGCDGNIYCIPGHAPRVLKIDTTSDEVEPIGPIFEGKYKWLRGIRCGDTIFGLPCHADSVLRIDVATGDINTIPIPYESFYNPDGEASPEEKQLAKEQREMIWKYHGGSTSPLDGCIYTIPQSALHVLRIDPKTDKCSFVGAPVPGKYKFYGGVVGKNDGAIYAVPHNHPSVLRIDPSASADEIVTLHGDFGTGGHKWHGASTAPNGIIVSVPANEDTVLCIEPGKPAPTLTYIGGADVIQTGRHRSDRKYKFLGAMTGTDGKVYCFPCGSEEVLQVDANSMTVRNVGPNLFDSQMEPIMQNKWQNGLTSVEEQSVYAIPLAANHVLKIDTTNGLDEPVVTTWKLPSACKGLAKWEGGVLADSGVMYCVPNNFKAVLRIEPTRMPTFPTKQQELETESQLESGKQRNGGKLPKSTDAATSSEITSQEEEEGLLYLHGIPTLRSSAHRVKGSLKKRKNDPKPRRDGLESHNTWLPPVIREECYLSYDSTKYNLRDTIAHFLHHLDSSLVGSFPQEPFILEEFKVPPITLGRSDLGGQCQEAQHYLSNAMETNTDFLEIFDRFVTELILPHLKGRLVAAGLITLNGDDNDDDDIVTFYYQRPPTLRLQPGPAKAFVRAHNDAEYGHQHGELNYWVPLTDRCQTGVDLWCESEEGSGDYHTLPAEFGQVVSFHGSSCRHYVNRNQTSNTRVSLDFRVGVERFFDPLWQMNGTTHDHNRREVRV